MKRLTLISLALVIGSIGFAFRPFNIEIAQPIPSETAEPTPTPDPTPKPRLVPDPQVGKATWYGATSRNKGYQFCYGGYRYTCTPYRTLAQGGWEDEVVNYCAVPGFKYHETPFWVMLTELKSGKTALCKVRDSCGCVGGGIIDLSPVVFLKFAKLGVGVIRVKIERVEVTN
jgi:hypothetical protein